MDPVSQAVLGAAAAQVVLQKRLGSRAWLYGAIGGMAADLDVLIRDDIDPLVAWTYHRHFTHSLVFVPVGGVISAVPWVFRKRFAKQRTLIIAATTLGYATHALLDAFTSYGTQLWWPFTNTRVAWHWIAVVDPLFTVPLGIGVILAAVRERLRPLWIALAFCALYMGFGGVQHSRALTHARALADARGHEPSRMEALPSLFTNLLWRSVYEFDGRIFVDAVHVPWLGEPTSRPGGSLPKLTEDDRASLIQGDTRIEEALDGFSWFADDWVSAPNPEHPDRVGDLRYGKGLGLPDALWGMEVEAHADEPLHGYNDRPGTSAFGEMWSVWWRGFE